MQHNFSRSASCHIRRSVKVLPAQCAQSPMFTSVVVARNASTHCFISALCNELGRSQSCSILDLCATRCYAPSLSRNACLDACTAAKLLKISMQWTHQVATPNAALPQQDSAPSQPSMLNLWGQINNLQSSCVMSATNWTNCKSKQY